MRPAPHCLRLVAPMFFNSLPSEFICVLHKIMFNMLRLHRFSHNIHKQKSGQMQAPIQNDTDNSALLTLVVPFFNEAENIVEFLPSLVNYCRERNWELTLVDDGSSDSSLSLLKQFADGEFVRIFGHGRNMGYGAAIKTGLAHVRTPFVVTIDGDGQHKLEDIDVLLEIAQNADADMVIGSRVNQQKEDKMRKTGKSLIRSFARLLMPLTVEDLNSGFKLYRAELVQNYASLAPDGMAFSDTITLCFIHNGHKVLEHPIQTNPRTKGKSTINLFTAFDTILQILNISVLFNPLKVFLPASLFFILVGFLWGIPFVIMGRGVSVGAMLSILAGLIFFAIGLIAHQLSALRMQLLNQHRTNSRNAR